MVNTIKLTVEAKAANLETDLLNAVQQVSTNSLSEILDAQTPAHNILSVTIQTTSDKLEAIYYKLAESGILLTQNAGDILLNAASQYSLYRDIHLNLNIEAFS
jgi:hypothetical protein